MEGRWLLVAALALSLGTAASAQPAGRCTHETLMVRGIPLTAAYCVSAVGAAAPGRDLPVHINETYSSPRGSFSQDATLRFISGEAESRVIEDVALKQLGMDGTLHLTLLLRGGLVHIEGAMLTPGAVTIK